jgi:hypothetical protein
VTYCKGDQPFKQAGNIETYNMLREQKNSNICTVTNEKQHHNKSSLNLLYRCDIWACLYSAREFLFGSIFEMPIRITSCKSTSVILEQNFSLFWSTHEKACSRVHVLQIQFAKFLDKLRKSENQARH